MQAGARWAAACWLLAQLAAEQQAALFEGAAAGKLGAGLAAGLVERFVLGLLVVVALVQALGPAQAQQLRWPANGRCFAPYSFASPS